MEKVLGAVAITVVITVLFTAHFADEHWKTQLVEKGHAEYNQTTGKWQWKECRHDQAD